MGISYCILHVHNYTSRHWDWTHFLNESFTWINHWATCLKTAILSCSHDKWKKALRETQTLHAGRSNAEPKIFAPPQTPIPGAQDGQNLISWSWSLPSPTDPVWWRSMHAISSYRGNRPTHKQCPPVANTQTGPITIHCTAKLSTQSNDDSHINTQQTYGVIKW